MLCISIFLWYILNGNNKKKLAITAVLSSKLNGGYTLSFLQELSSETTNRLI